VEPCIDDGHPGHASGLARVVRVALVVPSLAPSSGGPAENVPRLATALANEGVRVELHWEGSAAGEAPPVVPEAPVESRKASPAWPHRLGRSPEMMRQLLASRAEIVHAHCVWMLPLGYAARSARKRRVPLVISPRGMLAPWSLQRSRLKKSAARLLVHRGAFLQAAGWHATSEQEADDIRALGFTAPICIAPNGIESPSHSTDDAKRAYGELAPELRGRRVLLFYSRFHSTKRILELVRDFSRLAPSNPSWHLLAVGIPEEYSVDRIKAEGLRYQVSDRMTVLDGRTLPKPYALAHLFVLPSHVESFGRVVAEALAAGLPVVTTKGTPWEGLITAGAGSWVPLEGVPTALAEFMSRNEGDLQRAGELGREWVEGRFSWAHSARLLAAFYEDMLRGQRLRVPELKV
jgi:glycosyltransferase involved in cell wall biosynthesis